MSEVKGLDRGFSVFYGHAVNLAEETDLGRHLADLLNQLWRSPSDWKGLAQGFVPHLTEADWLLLAAWDTLATIGPANGRLVVHAPCRFEVQDSWAKTLFRCRIVRGGSSTPSPRLICFRSVEWSVALDGAAMPLQVGPQEHDPVALLASAEWIRDHADTVFYSPSDLREAQFSRIAETLGIERDHFSRLVVSFAQIAAYVANA